MGVSGTGCYLTSICLKGSLFQFGSVRYDCNVVVLNLTSQNGCQVLVLWLSWYPHSLHRSLNDLDLSISPPGEVMMMPFMAAPCSMFVQELTDHGQWWGACPLEVGRSIICSTM
jgi:hypothetical protein